MTQDFDNFLKKKFHLEKITEQKKVSFVREKREKKIGMQFITVKLFTEVSEGKLQHHYFNGERWERNIGKEQLKEFFNSHPTCRIVLSKLDDDWTEYSKEIPKL